MLAHLFFLHNVTLIWCSFSVLVLPEKSGKFKINFGINCFVFRNYHILYSKVYDVFCTISWIKGHWVHQRIELAKLPFCWILCPLIYDFIWKIFWIPWACTLNPAKVSLNSCSISFKILSHPLSREHFSLKIDVRDQNIWNCILEL